MRAVAALVVMVFSGEPLMLVFAVVAARSVRLDSLLAILDACGSTEEMFVYDLSSVEFTIISASITSVGGLVLPLL